MSRNTVFYPAPSTSIDLPRQHRGYSAFEALTTRVRFGLVSTAQPARTSRVALAPAVLVPCAADVEIRNTFAAWRPDAPPWWEIR